MSDFAYRLKTTEIGAIVLAADLTVRAVSGSVAALLRVAADRLVGRPLLDMHPGEARARVELLLAQARQAREAAASMMVPYPGRTIHVRVCPLAGGDDGFVVVLHGLDDGPQARPTDPQPGRFLLKLPVESGGVTLFLDPDTAFYLQADGHYSRVHAASGSHFCALPLADLERRLDPAVFFRPHRSYLVNLRHVGGFRRRDTGAELVMARPEGHAVPVSRSRVAALKDVLAV
ncbi:PAS domain-containing transcriptional regulator [Caenispirillum bisanense]|uniref:PAS domain-containing transcriptional regulator n=1 Tax=Caenispirillum bisanense TaxID=414052 RepID=UPI0031E350CA